MKKTKIIYWVTTLLFAGFMIMSAIPNILVDEQSRQFMQHLGYPIYIIPFLGVAKLLGSLAILVPVFKKIKEWAYAGLFFDLIGAVYSNIMTDGFQPPMLMMFPIFAVAIASYLFNQKYYSQRASGKSSLPAQGQAVVAV